MESKTPSAGIPIWKTLQKVPAGIMFVPLLIGAGITTICEGLLHVSLWETLGNPMEDLFSSSGQMLLIGLLLFCTGVQLRRSDLTAAMRRGSLLILVRLSAAYLLCAGFYLAFGYEGVGGISFLAFVCAVTSANGALYMGIIQSFGDASDKANFSLMTLCSMPLLPLLFLSLFGSSGSPLDQLMQILSLLLPFVLGVVLGNLDAEIRRVFSGGGSIILPFLGFEFGSSINLLEAFRMLPQGLLLSLLFFLITILPSYFFERRVLGRPGYISVASSSLAGVSLAIPAMAAEANPTFLPYVGDTVATLAFVLAATNLLCPFLSRWELRRHPAFPES